MDAPLTVLAVQQARRWAVLHGNRADPLKYDRGSPAGETAGGGPLGHEPYTGSAVILYGHGGKTWHHTH
eukprot:6623255-Alexandrium_andersonii.AAC.1